MRRSRKLVSPRLLGTALGLATLASTAHALAFCRTSSCAPRGGPQQTGAQCTPNQPSDCGIALFWPTLCVSYSFQKDASTKGTTLAIAREIFDKAFGTWLAAPCSGGGHPQISVTELDAVDCDLQEYNQKVGNANSIIFRDDGWPYEGSSNTLALTTVTYNLDNGQIYDADMELNSTDVEFTTVDQNVKFDLLSVVTHEAGHFLGLAHSPLTAATMFASYKPGDKGLRDLDADDIAGVCDIYPPGNKIPDDCDPTPRHGFSITCGNEQSGPGFSCDPLLRHDDSSAKCSTSESVSSDAAGGCCAVAPGQATPMGGAASAVAALGALVFFSRRRHRPSPKQ